MFWEAFLNQMAYLRLLICLALVPVFAQTVNADESTWVMPVQEEDLSPFKHRKNGVPGGIEVDLAKAVAKKVGVKLEFASLSVAQGRKGFQEGKITIDCCLNQIWFPGPSNEQAQLFSKSIYRLIEIWFFPRGKSFPIGSTKDLKDKRVAGIKGFSYPGENDFGSRIDGKDVASVLQLLVDGKADVAVLERHAAKTVLNHQSFDVEFGPLYYDVNVGLRLHRSLENWLPKVNKAIRELKADGAVETIIQANMR